MTRWMVLGCAFGLWLVAGAAHASFPSLSCVVPTPLECEFAGIPPEECVTECSEPGGSAYLRSIRWVTATGEACDNDTLALEHVDEVPPQFDEPLRVTVAVAGQPDPVECTPVLLKKPRLRAFLTLVADSATSDKVDDQGTTLCAGAPSIAVTAILEFQAGKRQVRLVDSLMGCGGLVIEPWDSSRLGSEIETTIFDANPFNSLLSSFSFEDEVSSIALDEDLLPPALSAAPVIVGDEFGAVSRSNNKVISPAPACEFGCGAGEVDARGDGNASVARYHFTIRFACPASVDPALCR